MELTSKEFKSELILEVQACLQLAVPLVITQILEAGIPLLDSDGIHFRLGRYRFLVGFITKANRGCSAFNLAFLSFDF